MAREKREKRKPSVWARILILIIALGLVVGGCFGPKQEEPENGPGEMRIEVVLGAEMSFVTAPVWIAEYNGYFQDEGLNVSIIGFDSGKASLAAMLDQKELDISTVAQTPIMFNSFNRNDFVIIATMVHSDNDIKVLARQDKGIRNPSDLRGSKVGITRGSTGQFLFDLFLTHNDILSSEVETMDLTPSELPQALVDGRVDAICTWEPHIANAQELLGQKALILPSKGIYRTDFYFVADRNFMEKSPEILEKFLRAIEKAEEFIRENEEEAISIVSERLGLDKEFTTMLWSVFDFQLLLDQSILTSLEDEARWAIRNHLVDNTEVPNYLNYIYLDALEEVKPEAVTIIR